MEETLPCWTEDGMSKKISVGYTKIKRMFMVLQVLKIFQIKQ
jgi:hypothetical protein